MSLKFQMDLTVERLDLKAPIELTFLMLSGTIFQIQAATDPRETADLLSKVFKNDQKMY